MSYCEFNEFSLMQSLVPIYKIFGKQGYDFLNEVLPTTTIECSKDKYEFENVDRLKAFFDIAYKPKPKIMKVHKGNLS
jgi:hypothetical protein